MASLLFWDNFLLAYRSNARVTKFGDKAFFSISPFIYLSISPSIYFSEPKFLMNWSLTFSTSLSFTNGPFHHDPPDLQCHLICPSYHPFFSDSFELLKRSVRSSMLAMRPI